VIISALKLQFACFLYTLLKFFIISPVSFCLLFTGLKMRKLREINFLVKNCDLISCVALAEAYCWIEAVLAFREGMFH